MLLTLTTTIVALPRQALQFGDRSFDVTIAAMPHYIASRKSSLPEFVVAFAVTLVVFAVGFVATAAIAVVVREHGIAERRLLQEVHKQAVIEASKEAHERTIAYACHQLRSG